MRKFLLKTTLFVIVVIAIQMMLPLSKEIPNEIKLLDAFMKLKADVVYFGDSTINWAPESDVNQESMPGLLQIILPKKRIAKITHASYQPAVYEAYAKYMIRNKYYPQFVIIPINMRIFSPEWDQQPLWQFEKETLTLGMKDTLWMKFYQPLAVLKYFEPRINRFDYEQTDVFDAGKLIGKVRDFDNPLYENYSDDNMKNKIRFRYAGPVLDDHRKLNSLIRTAQILRSAGIDPIFYVTPLDVQSVEKYLGHTAVVQIDANVRVVKDSLDKAGFSVLDLSRLLPSSQFSWREDGQGPYYPNEHLRLHGRMAVVKILAVKITALEK